MSASQLRSLGVVRRFARVEGGLRPIRMPSRPKEMRVDIFARRAMKGWPESRSGDAFARRQRLSRFGKGESIAVPPRVSGRAANGWASVKMRAGISAVAYRKLIISDLHSRGGCQVAEKDLRNRSLPVNMWIRILGLRRAPRCRGRRGTCVIIL